MRPFLTLHDPAQARYYYAEGLWRDETFYDLLAGHAATRAGAAALRDGRRTLTWGDLKASVDGVATDLAAAGIEAGDRVSLWLSNRIEGVVMFLACTRQGIACNPSLHRTYTCEEIIERLQRLKARALLTESGWGADRTDRDFEAMLGEVVSLAKIYDADAMPPPGSGPGPAVSSPDKVAYLAFTSGTTGEPKCVMHSDNSLLANARDMVRDWGHDDSMVLASLSPLSHHIAWVAVAQWLVAGGLFVTDDAPDGTSKLDWILENEATYVMGVPTHAMDILAEQQRRGIARLGAVRVFYMAGAPIPPSVAEAFTAQGILPQNVYGMTECSSHQYTLPADAQEVITGTCGRGGPAYEVRLFDAEDDNRPVAEGESGQIGGRGACLMLGYFADQEATEASFNRDGWFLSGDLGRVDADGNLSIVGRMKDIIIRGGHNIHPAKIEDLALKHPAVEKAAVFAVADARLGEKVCLAVLGSAVCGDLLAHLDREGLSLYDMPEYFLTLEEFPLTASGKILKRELAAMVRRGELAPVAVRYRAESQDG